MLENHPQSEKDYCPVSILPALSKEFEQFVLKQLIFYIDELSLLAPSISGFHKGHSTVTALLGIRGYSRSSAAQIEQKPEPKIGQKRKNQKPHRVPKPKNR